ncbi:4a-hydroxytetrahydrobiopterin dehydratase [Rhodococcus sp. IEGM 1408]|uniref:4a-hydroxytetrahydrobiopterin dehydratase n=1 Tax=Rhodococcus sp. IEGM 1408 TaxID=3082220 RepID=UPI002953B0C0|nr:4a-hydroxytetrahydrobiopterin dehydratase [Rhodococcus sp. IEGM 1408]MDV8002160.1 4a-hydroxytetrahydrobiopterin dehydratase [Rhodococcus sp. IEGM 1408]
MNADAQNAHNADDADAAGQAPDAGDNTRLTEEQIAEGLADLPGWALSEGSLTYTAVCETPQAAINLVAAIGQAANSQDHHPDLLWSYDEVTLDLRSHDVEGVTRRDLRLARSISALSGEYNATPLGIDGV